jgi:hypothetical protein
VFRLVGRRGWDICGPFPESLGGKGRYMLLFIDDATRYTWCYILEHKSDAEAKFHDWEAEMQTQYSLQVKRFRTDGGGEFTSKRFLQHLRDHGIHKETTATVSIEARRLPILPLSSISLPTSFIRVMLTWSRSLPLICSPDVTDPQARSDLLTSLLSMTMVSRSHSPFRYTAPFAQRLVSSKGYSYTVGYARRFYGVCVVFWLQDLRVWLSLGLSLGKHEAVFFFLFSFS